MKKVLTIFVVVLILALALPVSAEFVPCLTPDTPHDFADWRVVALNDNDTATVERACAKCGYVQKGVAPVDAHGVVAAEDGTAVILSESIAMTRDAAWVAVNPNTGARV